MSKIEVVIEVPPEFMVEAPEMHQFVHDLVKKSGEKALSEWLREAKRTQELDEVLVSDDALAKWTAKEWYGQPPPLVRASTYKRVDWRQELRGYGWGCDPRRPVVMRGAIGMLQIKYTAKSAMAEEVAMRYLRRIKFTSFDRAEINDKHRDAILRSRYPHFRDKWLHIPAFIDGEPKHLDEDEIRRLAPLYKQVKKLEVLEQRVQRNGQAMTGGVGRE